MKRSSRRSVAVVLVLLIRVFTSHYACAQSAPAPPVVPSSGAGFQTLAAFTLPPTFYVGDHVELRIRLKLAGGASLRAPSVMPSDRWIEIDSISITESKDYSVVHIFFVSFAPGRRSFPEINLGGIALRGIAVTTASLVSEGRTRLTEPKGQIALPGTTLILGVGVALLIGLPLAFVLLFRRFRYALSAFLEQHRARRPWRQLSRALDALAAEKPPLNPRRFYITLSDELRRYLTSKYGRDFRAITAREFSNAAQSVSMQSDAVAGLSTVMSFGETVKFAGASADEDVLRRDLAQVKTIIQGIEVTSERELRARQLEQRRPTGDGRTSDRAAERLQTGGEKKQ